MICTFGDLTDVTWWRELALPVRAVIQPDGTLSRSIVFDTHGLWASERARQRERRLRARGRTLGRQGPDRNRRAAEGVRRADRRAAPHHARGEVLREGRPAARDRHEPAVVHQDHGVPRGAAPARPRTRVASAVHAESVRELDQRPERRLVREPPAVFRRAVSRVVSAGCERPDRSRQADRRSRGSSAGRPLDRRARRFHRSAARQAGRLRRRPGHHGHVGDLVADAADRVPVGRGSGSVRAHVPDGPEAPGARHHPHVALRHRPAVALRARLAAVEARGPVGLGPRSRPQEDVQVEGQRGHAAGAARGARVGRRPLLGRQRASGHRHGVRHESDEGGPAAGDEAAQRVEVRAERGRAEGADQLGGRPRDAAQPGRAGSTRPPRPSRATTTRARCRGPKRSSGASATTTSSS